LSYKGPTNSVTRPAARTIDLADLDHPALSVRLATQHTLTKGLGAVGTLVEKLGGRGPANGRIHALWALDASNHPKAREAIRWARRDPAAEPRLRAARSGGIRRDRQAVGALSALLRDRDAAVRREAAIALGKIGDPRAGPALLAALGDADTFAA